MNTYHNKLISFGALMALIGYITSGPLGFILVRATHPQPEWVSPSVFAANYHFVQDIPYYLGLLLIGGMVVLVSGHFLQKTEKEKTRLQLLLSLLFTGVFAALIFFNYICQTTFIRNLALYYKPENDPIIASFSMANPQSLSWSIEIWGYGILGLATWLLAEYYKGKNVLIWGLLILNGTISLGTVVVTIADINWVLTKSGIIAYMFWNILMIALMILIYFHHKKEIKP